MSNQAVTTGPLQPVRDIAPVQSNSLLNHAPRRSGLDYIESLASQPRPRRPFSVEAADIYRRSSFSALSSQMRILSDVSIGVLGLFALERAAMRMILLSNSITWRGEVTIVSSLRRARRRARVSLSDAATRSGVGITNLSAIENDRRHPTTETAQRIADALGVAFVPVIARGRSTAVASVDAIAQAEAVGDHRLAYRQFIQFADDLAAVDPVTRVLLSAEEPDLTGTRWDDAVAALVEYRLVEAGAPLPRWISERGGDPHDPWEPQRAAVSLPFPADVTAVAEPFLRRGVHIEENELASA